MNDSPVIDPKNVPLWTAVTFIIALLAIVMSTVALYRIQVAVALTQAEMITLNRHIATLKAAPTKTAQAPAVTSAPAATATK